MGRASIQSRFSLLLINTSLKANFHFVCTWSFLRLTPSARLQGDLLWQMCINSLSPWHIENNVFYCISDFSIVFLLPLILYLQSHVLYTEIHSYGQLFPCHSFLLLLVWCVPGRTDCSAALGKWTCRETRVLHPRKSSGALSGKHAPLQKSLADMPCPPSASALVCGREPFTRPCLWSLMCSGTETWEVSNGLGPTPV